MMNVLSGFIQLDCKDGQLTKCKKKKQHKTKTPQLFFAGFVLFCLATANRIDGRNCIATTKNDIINARVVNNTYSTQ